MKILNFAIVLTLLCSFSAGLLSYVNQKTLPIIAQSIKNEKLKAIKAVLLTEYPNVQIPVDPDKDCEIIEIKDSETSIKKSVTFYNGKNSDNKTVCVAVKTSSLIGYSGKISLMFGFSIKGKVIGTYILEHAETPGLGSKLKEDRFKNQFKNLSFNKDEIISITKDGGEIESISGASISSRAFTTALNEAKYLFLKRYKTNGNK